MKTNFLFPNRFKKIGWIVFIPSFAALMSAYIFKLDFDNFLNINVFAIYEERIGNKPEFFKVIKDSFMYELISIGLILGGILINFSKMKNEDEYTMQIRYESLVWATYFNYAALLFFILFLYGFPFIDVIMLNLYSLLIFFMIRFHYKIYQLNRSLKDEK